MIGVARKIEQCAVFRRFEVACAERHALIEANTATDDARRPNHHTCAVVDGKLGADFCARVDVDPGARMRQFADMRGTIGTPARCKTCAMR